MADEHHDELGSGHRHHAEHDGHPGDELVELVLGTAEGDQRARLAEHVVACPSCRQEYDELSATLEGLVVAVPAVQPPLGFDEHVLARVTPSDVRTRRARWPWLVAAAAAVALALLVPLGIWTAAREDTSGDLATLVRASDGTAVGSISVTDLDGDPVMVVAFVHGRHDVAYFCRVRFTDGTTLDTNSWPGNGAWVVPLEPGGPEVASVDVLPAGTDTIWSSATFR